MARQPRAKQKKRETMGPRGTKGPNLTDEQKAFITVRLACFGRLSVVQKEFLEEYGRELILQTIEAHDPTKALGKRKVADRWRTLFEETRKEYQERLTDIPIANAAWRLQELQNNYDALIERKNVVGANAVIEQAAKEAGGAFTNKRQLSGPGDGPINVRVARTLNDFYADITSQSAAGAA